MIPYHFRFSLLMSLLLVPASLALGATSSDKLKKPRIKNYRTGGITESQFIQSRKGTVLIRKKGTSVSKVIIVTPKFQITKFGVSLGNFQFIKIAKREKHGHLVLTLEYDRLKKNYQPRFLRYLPHQILASNDECSKSEMQKKVQVFLDTVQDQEADETYEFLNKSSSIDSSCKNLKEPDRSNLFSGIIKAIRDDDAELRSCLDRINSDYSLFMRYGYQNTFDGDPSLKIQCASLPEGIQALSSSGAPVDGITFGVPFKQGCNPEEIRKAYTHELMHLTSRMATLSGAPTTEPHDAVDCCVNNDPNKCSVEELLRKETFLKHLNAMKGIPTLREFFLVSSEAVSAEQLAMVETAYLGYQDRLMNFFNGNPSCVINEKVSEVCSQKFAMELISYQKEWFQRFCIGKPCGSITPIANTDIASLENRTERSRTFFNAQNQPGMMETIFTDSSNAPSQIPVAESAPERVLPLMAAAEQMRIFEPDSNGPRTQKLERDLNERLRREENRAESVLESLPRIKLFPQANAASVATRRNPPSEVSSKKDSQNNIPFAKLPTASQLSIIESVAKGKRVNDGAIDMVHNEKTTVPETNDGITPEPTARIQFGTGNKLAPRAVAKETSSSTGGASPEQPKASNSSIASVSRSSVNTGNANFSDNTSHYNNNNAPTVCSTRNLTSNCRWSNALENDSAFRKYLKDNRIKIVKINPRGENRAIIGIQNPTQVFNVSVDNILRPIQEGQTDD